MTTLKLKRIQTKKTLCSLGEIIYLHCALLNGSMNGFLNDVQKWYCWYYNRIKTNKL